MSKVDRSYSEYKAIREYVDRGKMKWNPFATAELNSEHRTYKRNANCEIPKDLYEMEEKYVTLTRCINSSLLVNLSLKHGNIDTLEQVKITDFIDSKMIVVKKQGYYLIIEIENIFDITMIEGEVKS